MKIYSRSCTSMLFGHFETSEVSLLVAINVFDSLRTVRRFSALSNKYWLADASLAQSLLLVECHHLEIKKKMCDESKCILIIKIHNLKKSHYCLNKIP